MPHPNLPKTTLCACISSQSKTPTTNHWTTSKHAGCQVNQQFLNQPPQPHPGPTPTPKIFWKKMVSFWKNVVLKSSSFFFGIHPGFFPGWIHFPWGCIPPAPPRTNPYSQDLLEKSGFILVKSGFEVPILFFCGFILLFFEDEYTSWGDESPQATKILFLILPYSWKTWPSASPPSHPQA